MEDYVFRYQTDN